MQLFAPYEPNLKKIKRRQAMRFGMPVLVFSLLMALLVAAVYYAQQDERDQNQAKLIADALWARQNIQFQVGGLINSLQALTNDSLIYPSARLAASLNQLSRSSGELVAVFRGPELEPIVKLEGNFDEFDLEAVRQLVLPAVSQRYESRLDGLVGPFLFQGRHYVANVSVGQRGEAVTAGLIDLDLMLEKELPWWFAQDNQVELLDASGAILSRLVKASPGAGVYMHTTSLELGGLQFQLRVNSIQEGPRLFNYGITGALAFLLLLLLLSFIMLWRDSRRRLEIEARLEEEKLFRQSMQDSMAVGLRVWDLQGFIRYVNPAFCNMVGYKPEELIGIPQPLPYWPSKSAEEYKRLVANVISGNAPPEGFETIYQHKNGKLIDVLIVEAPLKDVRGVHTGWMSSVIDITDRKRSESLIAEQREKLQAASRFALVGEVASNIAHELNQPLATMVSYAQAGMNLSQRGASLEMYGQLFEKLRDQAQRAGRVVGSVQNLVRKRKPTRENVRVAELIDSIQFMVNSTAMLHQVRLHFDIAAPDFVLYIDRIMVEQALVNLVKNASEAFTASQRIRNVWIRARQLENSFEFSVRDDGPGLSLNNTEKMFEALVSTKPDGLGLGLSLCRSVAESHGGRLKAEAVPTGGTCFTMDLPMAVKESMEGEQSVGAN
ncbi:two-component system sensor histidine kinase NtrB [Limnobacter alexandrii]|jgi:two-component system, LuxR family, sensor histidine kinase DctS|uniref:two-component system sensor histidine kinase NtrB n=1 Tax=Limnobacter alexandrii TaxID=2570352 RepID=UPI001107E6A9|nr:PAS domain-containing sensor histidine kinase [Limnobacter alexandrii]